MDETKRVEPETIRMLFELDRADDPQLYDDLIRFKKGTKRINRLRLLAREGVVMQLSLLHPVAAPRTAAAQVGYVAPPEPAAPIDMPLAADVFGAPITGG
ncbi:hypothetical protein E6C76_21055 [Pseudothauera nasutitermitis]|uniref:Uncharacterized protein n=1 Tax=Pseudothauera nasutitermitis TaxID=2565930 RepID=A0A4S4AN72_9RHOO|nr:hypothetical protein [Pseudothauera nasutitermitis]THF61084.1 hypothetical protein E6C76_21055 [Pseudothauera nasutitermitis]